MGIRALLRSLEEHVLEEVGKAAGLARLIFGSCCYHDKHGGRLGAGDGGREQAQAVGELLQFGHRGVK